MEEILMGAKNKQAESRDKKIVQVSIVGIIANVFLAGFKVVVGALSNSIAIILDAVNNISDAASSVITIIGTKLAAKSPDKKHPFGYGRIEYLSAMVISLIILYAGITSFVESVKKIIEPQTPDYAPVSLIIIAVAVLVKIILGRYVKAKGEELNSASLVNSGEDATLDSVISASTLVAAAIYILWHISLEAWLGAIISVVIIKSGIEMLKETLSEILGESAKAELVLDIKKTVCAFPDVHGAYDLVLNNYGPDTFNGSVHVEIPDTYTASEIDDLIRAIQVKVYEKHHILLTAIGIYSRNTQDAVAIETRKNVSRIAMQNEGVMQVHGFYLHAEEKTIRFDAVISFDVPDRREVFAKVVADVQAAYPDYRIIAAMDTDYSELVEAKK